MIFESSYITDAGQELLTRSVAGTQIIWGTCGLYNHTNINSLSDAQVNALTSLNNPCALGQASSVFNGSSNTARIDCQCSNSETGCTAGQALAFGLWAKLQGDASEVLVAIARTGTYTPTTFPTYDGTPQTKLIGVVDLTISINPGVASTITINPALYALANNLQTEIEARQDLQDRVVTTHVTGNEFEGEDQTIYGKKKFDEVIHPNHGLQWPAIPLNGGYSLWARASRFGISGGFDAAGIRVFSLNETATETECTMMCTYDTETEKYTLTCNADNVVFPYLEITNRVEMGLQSSIYFGDECTISKSSIILEGETSTNKEYDILVCASGISTVKSKLSLTSDSSNEGKIDLTVFHSSNTMKGIHITKDEWYADMPFRADGGIKGITTSKPGCPMLAFIPANTLSTNYGAGTTITISANTVKYAKINGSTITGGSYIPAASYVVLSEYTYSQDSVVLLMRA